MIVPPFYLSLSGDPPPKETDADQVLKERKFAVKVATFNMYLMAVPSLTSGILFLLFGGVIYMEACECIYDHYCGGLRHFPDSFFLGLIAHVIVQFAAVILGFAAIEGRLPLLILPLILYTALLLIFFTGCMCFVGLCYFRHSARYPNEFLYKDLILVILLIVCIFSLAAWAAFALCSFWSVRRNIINESKEKDSEQCEPLIT